MKTAISFEDLQRYAEKLPHPRRHHVDRCYRLAVYGAPEWASIDQMRCDARVDVDYIEFHAEPVRIRGARAIAWFYHDLLVKVSV